MRYIIKGSEPRERVEMLLKFTKIKSENMKAAIVDHYVNGLKEAHAALLNNVKQQNLNKALKRLNEMAGVVEEIKEYDWQKR
tara:strand:+ start:4788 stop:5033 length:246 start_codon:yes stop_codon:yes gene_type:complete